MKAKFVASYSTRKNLLAKTESLYFKTRLSIRNLPLTTDENKLRILGKIERLGNNKNGRVKKDKTKRKIG
ncbi:hypothetical protein GLOIN_2v1729830 [Rhizophagus clarus]|uniref:Uncharacterized protein n=1 Tax=Rhizophagus clarus TaxID=94130 RepID=A0A8H3R5B0_9GLOM|nr:hypothetical protein GLOIN_2v1729830 [Rhizophagus clarus]